MQQAIHSSLIWRSCSDNRARLRMCTDICLMSCTASHLHATCTLCILSSNSTYFAPSSRSSSAAHLCIYRMINLCIVQSDVFTQDHHSFAYTNARSVRQAQRQAQLEALLSEVITRVNEKRAHIPPVCSESPCSFPFDISISGGSRLSFGLGTVKRMLLHSSPPAVLG
eukprot:GHRR01018536.1.p2 GENE.GHRR01018536.1~~GHRR01018536.1.p2  ORF type:complete len:168 (+),score=19.38 GHRR01018536.1:1019-1522(+)